MQRGQPFRLALRPGLAWAFLGALRAGNVATDKPDAPRLRRAQGTPKRVQEYSEAFSEKVFPAFAVPLGALGGFRGFVRESEGRALSGSLRAKPSTVRVTDGGELQACLIACNSRHSDEAGSISRFLGGLV
jgi:hypothetical protein